MDKKKAYLPKVRTDYHPTESEVAEYNSKGIMPNPANDPIVVNNIVWQEGDYTESLFDEGEDTL